MLDEVEFAEVKTYVRDFGGHAMMPELRHAVTTLFNAADAPGCRTARAQLLEQPASDMHQFGAALSELFGC